DDPYTALVSFSDTGEVFTVEGGGAIPGLNGRITFQTESNTMNPGEYEIVAEGISSDFYNVVYVSGTLTVKEVKTDLAIGGIQIDNKGNATYNGKGVHMIGVNYISMFTNCLKSDGTYDTTVTKNGLAVLAENGCGLIRFWASVFYADSGYLYIDYQESFFDALDEIFDEAARLNIGLMPSVFFTSWFMDYYDEGYYEAWVDPANNLSKSMEYMETFTEQLIHRYANHPALFAWEFGNERNLGNDIPHWSGDNILDKPRIEIYTKVLEHWSTYIHERDPYQRLICSGDAHMRSSQYNQAVAGSWAKDTYEQHKAIVALHNSGYCHGVSAHNYGGYVDGSSEEGVITSLGTPQALYTPGYLADESPQTWAEVMRLQIRVAKELNKMAYIGECGTTGNHSMAIFTTKEERAERQYQVYKAIGDAVVETGLAYALYWNYDNTATLWEDDFDAELAASNSDSFLQRGSGIEWSWNENYLKGQAALRAMKETSEALKKKYGV
ncbi:MAG: cellulase family glycosylhydrolase, partial [Clostridia bacterium]|nr:cellulase family glycosylhydrolase [Clostridia bacterium]